MSTSPRSADVTAPAPGRDPAHRERRKATVTGSPRRRPSSGKRAAGKRERADEMATVARLALIVWELIWALVHERFTSGGSGRVL